MYNDTHQRKLMKPKTKVTSTMSFENVLSRGGGGNGHFLAFPKHYAVIQ